MTTTILNRIDGGIEAVCAETYPSGFTNHRVVIEKTKGGFICYCDTFTDKKVLITDLCGVICWLGFERCHANPYLARAAKDLYKHLTAK